MHISNYFPGFGKTESAKNLIYIYVSHICLSSYPHIELCLYCYFFFFPLWELIPLWLIFWHFFAISPPVYTDLVLSICPKACSSVFITLPFIYLLTFKECYGNNCLYPSFSPEVIMISVMPLPCPIFHQILLHQKKKLWITESGQNSQEQKTFTLLTLLPCPFTAHGFTSCNIVCRSG